MLTNSKKGRWRRRFAGWWTAKSRRKQAEIWTIIGGVVALLGFLISPGIDLFEELSGSTAVADSSPTPTISSPTPSPAPPVLYEGGFRLGADSKDLDASPPAPRPDVNDVVFEEKDQKLDLYENGYVALWRGKGKPDYRQCHDTAYAEGLNELEISAGRWYCLKTVESRIAAFFIEEAGKTVRGRLTVWEKP